jgi:hypothetical protein
MVSVIEPNSGSTPGIPDLVVSKGVVDLWVELKVTKENVPEVWKKLLRPAQRQWIKRRMKTNGLLMNTYVLVKTPITVNAYSIQCWSPQYPVHIIHIIKVRTLQDIVDLLNSRCS